MRIDQQHKMSLWIQTAVAVAESGSPAIAAKVLSKNITTVYRHLDSLEHSLGTKIFNRKNTGWTLLEEASVLLNTGKELEKVLLNAEKELRETLDKTEGVIRIAVSHDFAFHYLAPRLRAFCDKNDGIRLEVIVNNQFTDLETGAADVAIRPDNNPGDSLIGRRVGTMNHAFYASDDYLKRHSEPITLTTNNHSFCGYGQEIADYSAAKWLDSHIEEKQIITRFNDTNVMTNAVISGLGIGLLPCFVGDNLENVQAVLTTEDAIPVDIWLVAAETSRDRSKVKVFFDYFAEMIHADHDVLMGKPYLNQM